MVVQDKSVGSIEVMDELRNWSNWMSRAIEREIKFLAFDADELLFDCHQAQVAAHSLSRGTSLPCNQFPPTITCEQSIAWLGYFKTKP